MFKNLMLLVGLFLLLFCTQAQAQALSRKQVEANTKVIRRLLLYSHPAATQYISRDSLERALASINQFDGDSLSRAAFEYRVRQVLRAVGCGHTSLITRSRIPKPSKRKSAPRAPFILPLWTFTDGEKLWVRMPLDSNQSQIQAAAQIRAINGRPVAEMVDYLKKYQIPDGQSSAIGIHTLNQGLYFNALHRKYYPQDTLAQIEWQNPDGSVQSSLFHEIRFDKALKAMPKDKTVKPKALYKSRFRRFYFQPDRPDVGVLRIESFSGRGRRVYRKAFKTMEKQKTPYLIVDVRDNLGGRFNDCMNLTRYVVREPYQAKLTRHAFRTWNNMGPFHFLGRVIVILRADVLSLTPRKYNLKRATYYLHFKPRKRHHFDGQVFVLMNGWSASASSLMSAYMKEKGNAICIGQETGGGGQSLNGMQIPRFRLPEGRYKLAVPQAHLDFKLGPDTGRGVMPDHLIQYSIEDLIRGRDLEMEKALEISGK